MKTLPLTFEAGGGGTVFMISILDTYFLKPLETFCCGCGECVILWGKPYASAGAVPMRLASGLGHLSAVPPSFECMYVRA